MISLIWAMTRTGVIGKNNTLPWRLPADLQQFRRLTTGHHIIMGRKCFESIGRPLPKRVNVVITRDPFFVGAGLVVVRSVEEALEIALDAGDDEAFIIGGGQIYRQSLEFWDKIYLTEVGLDTPGDVFFPEIRADEWREIFSEKHPPDEKNEWPFSFKILEKIGEP